MKRKRESKITVVRFGEWIWIEDRSTREQRIFYKGSAVTMVTISKSYQHRCPGQMYTPLSKEESENMACKSVLTCRPVHPGGWVGN